MSSVSAASDSATSPNVAEAPVPMVATVPPQPQQQVQQSDNTPPSPPPAPSSPVPDDPATKQMMAERANRLNMELRDRWNKSDDQTKRVLASWMRLCRQDKMPDGFGASFMGPVNAANFFPQLTMIGNGCLNCTAVPFLELPPSLQKIGDGFANDTKEARKEMAAAAAAPKPSGASGSTSSVVRHGALKSLEKLERCTQLREIGHDFCRGASLRAIKFPPSLTSVGNNFMAHVVAAPNAKKDAAPLTIDLSPCTALTVIGVGFAEGCSAVTVHLPGSLQAIPNNCCVDMSALAEVDIIIPLEGTVRQMGRLSTIGDSFLLRAKSLTELDLDSFGAIVAIGNNFGRGSGLRRVVMPATLRTLGSGFCAETKDLETVDLAGAKALEAIGDDFCASSGVKAVQLPPDVQRIGANFLDRTKGLKELDLSHLRGSVALGELFLNSSAVEQLRVPKSLRETPKGFCQGTTGIQDLDLSMCRDLKYIRANFGADSAIKTLKLPPRVLSIDAGFLQRAYRVKELDLSVLTAAKRLVIGDDFLRMSSVATLVCPRIPLSIGNQFCSKCAALEEVDLSAADGLRIRDKFLLGAGVKALTLPTSLHGIGDDFCAETTNLDVTDLSKCVLLSSIGEDFGRASKIVKVILPQPQRKDTTAASLRDPTFGDSARVTIPRLVSIPDSFLCGAKSLDEIVFSPTLTAIGDEFCLEATSEAFTKLDATVCVNLVRIGDKFLSNCAAMNQVLLPFHVKELGKQFCSGTKKLKDLSLEQCMGLRVIGDKFAAGSAVESVRFPGCVKQLGAEVCDGCAAGCIVRVGVETLRGHMDSLNVDRNRAAELDLVRKLLKVLQRDEDHRTVAQRLLERGDVQLFLNVFDPTKEEVATKLRTVGGTRQHLPSLPPGCLLVLDTASPDYSLTLAHWAVIHFPDLLKKMQLSTEIVGAQTARGFSVLHYAVMHGVDTVTIKTLLNATSPSVARRIGYGYTTPIAFTPLHLAFAYRNFEAAAELLNKTGGYRGDPTETIRDHRVVPFRLDVYDLALQEWGRARRAEHLLREQEKEDPSARPLWRSPPPTLATCCLALSAVAAAMQAMLAEQTVTMGLRSNGSSRDDAGSAGGSQHEGRNYQAPDDAVSDSDLVDEWEDDEQTYDDGTIDAGDVDLGMTMGGTLNATGLNATALNGLMLLGNTNAMIQLGNTVTAQHPAALQHYAHAFQAATAEAQAMGTSIMSNSGNIPFGATVPLPHGRRRPLSPGINRRVMVKSYGSPKAVTPSRQTTELITLNGMSRQPTDFATNASMPRRGSRSNPDTPNLSRDASLIPQLPTVSPQVLYTQESFMPPPPPLPLPFAPPRSVYASAVALHLASHPDSRIPPLPTQLDTTLQQQAELMEALNDAAGFPPEVRAALRDGRAAAQQVPRYGVYAHRLVITSSAVAATAASVARRLYLLQQPKLSARAAGDLATSVEEIRNIAATADATTAAAVSRVANQRSDGDAQAIAKAEANTLRQAAKALLTEITDSHDPEDVCLAIQRLCADGIALSLANSSTAVDVEYRLRRYDRPRFTPAGERRDDGETGGLQSLPMAESTEEHIRQLTTTLKRVAQMAADACRVADSTYITRAEYHADEARECQAMIKDMEEGLYRDKLIEKFAYTVPLSVVLPSYAFFVLFMVYLLGGPTIFDVPKITSITGVVEGAAKSCLTRFTGGTAFYRSLRQMDRTDVDPGIVRWNCDLNLTHTIIQTTQRLYDRERNISFQLVDVADIPKLPQDTDAINYYPHALRFASKARYQGDNPSGRIWRYWVASEVQGGWPSDPKYWTDQSRNETRTFTHAESKRTYRHRVILEHFGDWGRAWTNAIWVACSLCVFALVYDIWYAVKISAQAIFPRRFPGKPVHLLPPSMGDVAVRIAIITVELLVVVYNFVWVIDFTALVHERVGDLAYADWNVGERFTRASASLKLSTLLVAIPGLAFARKVPKPNQFHITNAIAAAALLIAVAYAVESGPVFRIEDMTTLVRPDILFSINALGIVAVLSGFGAALFARNQDRLSKTARQWHYELLELRRREHAVRLAQLAAASDALVVPSNHPRQVDGLTRNDSNNINNKSTDTNFAEQLGGLPEPGQSTSVPIDTKVQPLGALTSPTSKQVDEQEADANDDVLRRIHFNALELARAATQATLGYRLPYRFWYFAQRAAILVACLAQLALYGVCVYVFVSPTLIDAPYGSVERPAVFSGIVSSITKK
jgi:hypothetical protein